jgi:hypothetical protein
VGATNDPTLAGGQGLELPLQFLARHLPRRFNAHHSRRLRAIRLYKAKELLHGCLLSRLKAFGL